MNINCFYQRGYHSVIGTVFILIGLLFMGMGFTVLPVVGFFIALPIIGLGFYFFTTPKSKECMMKEG